MQSVSQEIASDPLLLYTGGREGLKNGLQAEREFCKHHSFPSLTIKDKDTRPRCFSPTAAIAHRILLVMLGTIKNMSTNLNSSCNEGR